MILTIAISLLLYFLLFYNIEIDLSKVFDERTEEVLKTFGLVICLAPVINLVFYSIIIILIIYEINNH